MKKKITVMFIIMINITLTSQNFPYKFNRTSPDHGLYPCEFGVFVKDNRPSNCTFDNNFYLYPVIIEEFNSKSDLPNNWRFTMSYNGNDDNYGGNLEGITYLGNAYNNNNIYVNNGIGYLEWKKESVYANNKTYDYTGAFLNSFFKLRQGVFEARIKLPEYPIHFPAYWLLNNQEIDIFEFHDGDITSQNVCGTYHHMNMNIHGYIDDALNTNYSNDENIMTHCNRNRKFGVPSNFFQSYHDYKCVWTDYKVDIYLDGTLVASASRFYDGPFIPGGTCHTNALGAYVPAQHRDCNYMSSAPDCSSEVWVPNFPDFWNGHYECIVQNQVKKDMSFPQTNIPMDLIISNSLAYLTGDKDGSGANPGQLTTLNNAWSGLGIDDRRIGIDWIRVYQPVNCSSPRYICSISDFKTITGNTNFLSGSVIQMGNGSSCNLTNTESDNFPIHILASDEIQFSGDMFFEQNTYLRAEIIDCSIGFNQYQRGIDGEKLFLTDEEIAEIEQRQNDSLAELDPAFRDSLSHYNQRRNNSNNISVKSDTDNGAINLYPNPTEEELYVSMQDEDFNDLTEFEITDNLGRSKIVEKSKVINVALFTPGFYQIKFKFNHGSIVVKNFIRK